MGRQIIPSIDTTTTWKYLGINFNALGIEATPVLEQVKEYLSKVSKAPLKPQQRIVVLRSYLVPRLFYRLVFEPISGKLLNKIDRAIRLHVRNWLRLPHDVPIAFLHAPNKDGGLGVPSLRTAIPWMRLSRFAKLEESTYQTCVEASKKPYVVNFLEQTKRLLTYKNSRLDSSKACVKFWRSELHNSVDGKALREASLTPGAHSWLIEGTHFLTGREYINICKLHINAMPCLARTKRGRDVAKTCRAGCNSAENLGHILQICPRTHHTRISRHNVIAAYVAKRLRENEFTVLEEPHYRVPGGALVPDLVATRGSQTVVLDAQVVSTLHPLTLLHATKTAKYMNKDFLNQLGNDRPLVSSITMNYRGVWASKSVKTLRDLGLIRRDFKTLTIRCLQRGYQGFCAHQRMTTTYGG